MKLMVRIFGVLVGFWLLLIVVSFFLPGHYQVERTVVVAAPPERVFTHIGDLRAWREWGVWFQRDPAMQLSYSPVTTGLGAWSSWKSKTQGNGRMTISAEQPPSDFEYRMEFTDMAMVAHGTLLVAPAPGGSKVTMGMEGDLGHSPVNRWFGLAMNRLIGPDFEAGLANLKRLSETGK
jgi:uncharacterized protein YndB with AHSA1/START domain